MKKGQPVVDIFEVNRLRRQLLFQSYMWDHRLIYAASLITNSLQDDLSSSNPKNAVISFSAHGNPIDMNMPLKPGEGLSSSESVAMAVKLA